MVLPELQEPARPYETDRGVIFEAAARWASAAARSSGLVIVLEDLHWADPTTHHLVHHLARVTAGDPVALLITFRPGEVDPGSSLNEMRRELSRDRLADEMMLGPLGPQAVAEMLRGLLDAEPVPSLVDAFVTSGGGNPFATEELFAAAVAEGRVTRGEGGWSGGPPLRLPWTVSEMVLARVRRLPEADQEVLRTAAVAGDGFDPELVRRASRCGEEQMVAGLARMREADLLRDDGQGGVAFRHALAHEAVLDTLLGPERRVRHRRLLGAGKALAAAGQGVPLAVLLGHALGGGDRPAAFGYARLAADHSLALGGEAEALRHTERALDLWSVEYGARARGELLLQRGRLLHRVSQDHAHAEEVLETARRALADAGLPAEAGVADALRAASRWWSAEPGALDELRAARRAVAPDAAPEMHSEVLGELARPLMLSGHAREAAAIAEEGLRLTEHVPTRRARIRHIDLLTTLGTCRFIFADLAGAEATLRDCAAWALDHHDPVGACRALHNAAFGVDTLKDMHAYATAGLDVAREHGLRPYQRAFHIALAARACAAGDLAEAETRCLEAEAIDGPWQRIAHIRLDVALPRAFLALARGHPDEARARFAGAIEGSRTGREAGEWAAPRGLALALLALDDCAGAHQAITPALNDDERCGYARLLALPISARIAARQGDPETVGRLAEEFGRIAPDHGLAPVLSAFAALVAAASEAAAIRLAAAAADRARAGRRVEAAVWRLEGTRALAGRADAEAGDLALAALAALEAFREIGADGWQHMSEGVLRGLGRRAPTRPSAWARGELTQRELQVLSLVAEGLSNRAIAARLFISAKTAGRHVSNIFTKLGAHSRAQAVRLALEQGLLANGALGP